MDRREEPSTARPKAFVIMPFDAEFDAIFEDLIRQPLVDVGFDVSRADSLLHQQNILQDVVQGIMKADVVVADLTANNPNVFYELGLSHALGIPTVLIAQSITDVPFDLRSYKIHIYETHFNQIKKLKKFLRRIGEEHLKGTVDYRNPVSDFSPRAPLVETAPESANLVEPLSNLEQEKKEDTDESKEWLDYLADAEDATNDLTDLLVQFTENNEVVTNKIKKHSVTMGQLSNSPAAGTARKLHKLMLLAASDINSFSNKVEALLEPIDIVIERLNSNYIGLIETVEPVTENDKASLRDLEVSLTALLENSKKAKVGIHSFRDAGIELAQRRISKELTRASRRLADVLASVISKIDKVEAFTLNTSARLQQRFGDYLQTASTSQIG